MKQVAFIGAVVFACASPLLAQSLTPAEQQGKKLFDSKKCATCHTVAGKGGTLTKQYPLDGVGAKLSLADTRKWLTETETMEAALEKKPKVKMSSKKVPLTSADIDALVAYMQTLKTPPAK
jgi:mono/diheme cytochrome c family protein